MVEIGAGGRENTRRPLILLFVLRAFRSVAAGMIAIAFPYLVLRQYHYSALTLGLLYTAAAVVTAVFGLAVGILADVWGRRWTLWVVAITLPLSSGIVYLAHSLPWLFAATMIGGYSATGSLMGGGVGGAAQPIQTAIIASLTSSRERTFYFSIFAFASGLFAAGGALAARLFPVRELFLVATAVSLVGLAALVPFRVPEFRAPLRRLKGRQTIGQFSLTGMLNGFSQGLITPFLIPFFVLVYHLPKEQMATYGSIAGTVGAFALLAAPYLDRRLGFVRAIAATRGLGAVTVALLPIWHWPPLALGIYMSIPALRVAALPAQQRALTDMVPAAEAGRALGVNQIMRLGASAGAVTLTGYLFSEADFEVPFFVYAGVMAVNIILYFRFFGRSQQQFVEAASESRGDGEAG
jgi:MFS family permease